MPEGSITTEASPAQEVKSPSQEVSKKRIVDIGRATRAILTNEVTRSGAKDKKPEERTPNDKALLVYEQLKTGKDTDGKDLVVNQFTGGNPLVMSEFVAEIGGKERQFANGEVSIASAKIVEIDGERMYECTFVDATTGDPITLDVDDNNGEATQQTFIMPVPIDAVVDAQILAEQDTYETFFLGDDQKLFNAFIDSRPQINPDFIPPDEIDGIIDTAVTAHGLSLDQDQADTELQNLISEKSPVEQANDIINEQLRQLQDKLPTITDKVKKEQTVNLIVALQLAQAARGEVGVVFKREALRQLNNTGIEGIDTLITALAPEVAQAKERFSKLLEQAAPNQKLLDKWTQVLQKPEGMITLLQDKDFQKISVNTEALSRAIFGRTDVTPDEIKNFLVPNLSDEMKTEVDKLVKSGWSWWKILLAIAAGLIAVPVVAGLGAGMAGVGLIQAGARQN